MPTLSIREVLERLATIDTSLAEQRLQIEKIEAVLLGLAAATSRMPDGRTLINVVGTILDEVRK